MRLRHGRTPRTLVEPVLDTDVQGVVYFGAVERSDLIFTEKSRRCRIQKVVGGHAGLLDSRAICEIGRRKDSDSLLPIKTKRFLRQVIYVERGLVLELTPIGMISRIVKIDAGEDS